MILKALIQLMKEKDFGEISISEIMKKADLVRRTFYAHFKTKEDVLTMYIDQLFNESFEELLTGIKECNGKMGLSYFQLWNKHKPFIKLLKNHKQLILLNIFHKYIVDIQKNSPTYNSRNLSETAEKYANKFYAGTLWSILTHWIETGMKETPEELEKLLDELIIVSSEYVKLT